MISLGLFILSVIFYTLSQKSTFTDSESWKKKYKQPMTPAPSNWYYKLFTLKYRERFPLSGSLLTFVTDKYHFLQFCFKIALALSFGFFHTIINPYFDAAIYWITFGIIFSAVYYLASKGTAEQGKRGWIKVGKEVYLPSQRDKPQSMTCVAMGVRSYMRLSTLRSYYRYWHLTRCASIQIREYGTYSLGSAMLLTGL